MSRGRKWLACFMALLAVLPPTHFAEAGNPFKFFHRAPPPTAKDACVEDLAEEIDWLEHHLASYGTVVAKQPDVWGQARLTKHRHEFEKQMAAQLNKFGASIQGSLARSDQAYLAQAIALSAALSGPQAVQTLPSTTQTSEQSTTTQTSAPAPSDATPLAVPNVDDPSKFVSSAKDVINRNDAKLSATSVGFGTSQTIALEPTLHLDQMATYLNHLNELRRLNEGDDTADSPGYALTLVRIPVSVIPGNHTRKGYGAEITVTAEPVVTEELLPTTFRNLVVNDLVDQLSFPLTKVLDDKETQQMLDDFSEWEICYGARQKIGVAPLLFETYVRCKHGPARALPCCSEPGFDCGASAAPCVQTHPNLAPATVEGAAVNASNDEEVEKSQKMTMMMQRLAAPRALQPKSSDRPGSVVADSFRVSINSLIIPMSPSRRPQLPFPPSQLTDVYGIDLLAEIAAEIRGGLEKDLLNSPHVQFMDVQSILSQEINSAYDFLAAPENLCAWSVCNQALAQAVRAQNQDCIDKAREAFLRQIGYWESDRKELRDLGYTGDCDSDFVAWNTDISVALAWAIIVESALLNQQLLEDMQHVAVAKGCGCLAGAVGLHLGLPNPDAAARQAFIEYVKCRWPIHVFALDPVTADQNIADSFARRREAQFALSLAFTSGNIGARSFTNFARRLEWDYQTIALNRTMVAFSHGDDTFGWRFYPRFQSPDIESNGMVLFRDLFIGGPSRDAELKQRQIEPGMRECNALVIMPAFVPYVRFDVRTNWFRLTHPAKLELTTHQALKLSRSIKSVQSFAQCVSDGCAYRDGEVERLVRRIHQLDRALPLQTMNAEVPFEQTLGGFEMFSAGVRDLAPELVGYYGEPGINQSGETTIFIVGKGFSVHETRVIVGNQEIDPFFPYDNPSMDATPAPAAASATAAPARTHGAMVLLSRQIMQVTIPAGVQSVKDQVDIHVATPYGISNHLLVPLYKEPSTDSSTGFAWDAPAAVGYVKYDPSNGKAAEFRFEANSSDPLSIDDKTKFPQSLMPKKAYLVAQVSGLTTGGQTVALGSTNPIEVVWNGGQKKWQCPLLGPLPAAFEGQIERVLQANLGKSQNVASLQIVGFVNSDRQLGVAWNHQGATGLDGTPIVKLTNVMQVALKPVDAACCVRLPPCEPPAAGEAPAGAWQFPLKQGVQPGAKTSPTDIVLPPAETIHKTAPSAAIGPRGARVKYPLPLPKGSAAARPKANRSVR